MHRLNVTPEATRICRERINTTLFPPSDFSRGVQHLFVDGKAIFEGRKNIKAQPESYQSWSWALYCEDLTYSLSHRPNQSQYLPAQIHQGRAYLCIRQEERQRQPSGNTFPLPAPCAVHSWNTSSDNKLDTRESLVHLITHFLPCLRIIPGFSPPSSQTPGTQPGSATAGAPQRDGEGWWERHCSLHDWWRQNSLQLQRDFGAGDALGILHLQGSGSASCCRQTGSVHHAGPNSQSHLSPCNPWLALIIREKAHFHLHFGQGASPLFPLPEGILLGTRISVLSWCPGWSWLSCSVPGRDAHLASCCARQMWGAGRTHPDKYNIISAGDIKYNLITSPHLQNGELSLTQNQRFAVPRSPRALGFFPNIQNGFFYHHRVVTNFSNAKGHRDICHLEDICHLSPTFCWDFLPFWA